MPTRLLVDAAELLRANVGLRLNKFTESESPDLEAVTSHVVANRAYEMAYQRWEKHWRSRAASCVLVKGRVAVRLAAGLGNTSVIEVGMRLNATYGAPLVPGSSVKGVIRARLKDTEFADVLFGKTDAAGFTIFQDAWWIPEGRTPFAVDVLTPHHARYYQGEGAPPSDMDNPSPVPFLSVRGSFLFVAEFTGQDEGGKWKHFLEELMTETLEKDGVGAKRATGYGRFSFQAK